MVLLRTFGKLFCLLCVLQAAYSISAEPYRPQLLAVKVTNLPVEQRQIPSDDQFKKFDGVIRPDSHDFKQAYWVKVLPSSNAEFTADGLIVINPITLHAVDMYIPEMNQRTPVRSISRFDVKVDARYTRRSSVFETPLNYKANSPICFDFY